MDGRFSLYLARPQYSIRVTATSNEWSACIIPFFIGRVAQDEPITIYGLEKVLDFIYIDDCVDGVVRGIYSLVKCCVYNQTINLAYGQGNTLCHMAELVAQALHKLLHITLASPLLGEVTRYFANIEKARPSLGYQPQISSDKGINRTVACPQEWTAQARPPKLWQNRGSQASGATISDTMIEGAIVIGLGYKYPIDQISGRQYRQVQTSEDAQTQERIG